VPSSGIVLDGVSPLPNRASHLQIAVVAQSVIECGRTTSLVGNDRFWDVVGALAGASFGGMLPDLLEPALNPNHRQFCHGIVPSLSLITFGANRYLQGIDELYAWADAAPTTPAYSNSTLDPQTTPRWLRFFVAGFVRALPTGYLSHLLADAVTPKGLPLLGRL
jgi:hypothetical protein